MKLHTKSSSLFTFHIRASLKMTGKTCSWLNCKGMNWKGPITVCSLSMQAYWAIQVGLLTPLTSAWHCLSPLAAFTSGAYFLHNERLCQCEFYTANFKDIFWRPVVRMCLATSNNLLLVLQDAPKHIFSTDSRSPGQPKNDAKTLFFHPPSPFPW